MLLRRARSERGQGLVEFAVIFPLIVFFLFAVFEVGLGLNRQATLQHAVREGARAGALIDDDGTVAANRTISQSQGLLKTKDGDVFVTYENLGDEGCAVNVKATYLYKPAMLNSVLGFFGSSMADIEMDVTGSARMERKLSDPTQC